MRKDDCAFFHACASLIPFLWPAALVLSVLRRMESRRRVGLAPACCSSCIEVSCCGCCALSQELHEQWDELDAAGMIGAEKKEKKTLAPERAQADELAALRTELEAARAAQRASPSAKKPTARGRSKSASKRA
jgi:hypothetical protein